MIDCVGQNFCKPDPLFFWDGNVQAPCGMKKLVTTANNYFGKYFPFTDCHANFDEN